jgi:hypothetical protein
LTIRTLKKGLELDGSQNGREFDVGFDQSFEYRCQNPTTGYRKRLNASDYPKLELKSDTFVNRPFRLAA